MRKQKKKQYDAGIEKEEMERKQNTLDINRNIYNKKLIKRNLLGGGDLIRKILT